MSSHVPVAHTYEAEALTNLQEQIEAREASIAKIRSWATRGKE